MPGANAIATTEALLADGSLVFYRDAEPDHIREQRFRHILNGEPLTFTVTTADGGTFSVDLVNGELTANQTIFETTPPLGAKLRLVYFKRMESSSVGNRWQDGYQAQMVWFVVGWQTTHEGRNVRMGLKIDPEKKSITVTDDF